MKSVSNVVNIGFFIAAITGSFGAATLVVPTNEMADGVSSLGSAHGEM